MNLQRLDDRYARHLLGRAIDARTEAVEAWAQVHAGMQRLGMESEAIDVLAAYFAALSEQEGKSCNCGSVEFGVGAHWPGGRFGKVTCSSCGSEQEGK